MAYRRTEHVEARLADNRARIVHAARRMVGEDGFRSAQVAAIAAAAGVATGTVYLYFPSKAHLFAEVLRDVCQRELDVVADIGASGGGAGERLAAGVRAFASRALRARRLAYAIIAEPADPLVDEIRLDYRRAQGRLFAAVIADGVASGEFPAQDPQASAACLVGAFLEGLVGPLAPGATDSRESAARLVDRIVAFALRGVGAAAAPPPP
jgi:AcrR family transcriptional regulator